MAVGCIDWLGWLVSYLVQITGLLMFWAFYSAPCGQDKEHERKLFACNRIANRSTTNCPGQVVRHGTERPHQH